MPSELYRTYEVLIEESVHPEHPKRKKTGKACAWGDGKTYAALRDTNAIFQDAVCYYTILLAGLAGEAKANGKLLNPLWTELCQREAQSKEDVAKVLQRLAANYPGLPKVDCLKNSLTSVLTQGKSEADKTESYQILEAQLKGDGDEIDIEKLTIFAHDNGLRLCSITSQRRMPGSAPLDRLYWRLHSNQSCHDNVPAMVKEILDFLETTSIEPSDRVKAHYKTAFTAAKSKKAKKLLPLVQNQFVSIEAEIEKAEEDDKRFVWLHKTGPINPMAWLLARFLWLQKDESLAKVALEDLVAFIQRPGKKIPKPVGGDRESMPSKFHYFTHWLGIAFESPAFREKFDDAALSMAFEDVFKYKQRTQKREGQVAKLQIIQSAFEGGKEIKFDKENSPSGKAMTIQGMKGDPRWKGDAASGKKGIVHLLDELRAERELDEYGLRSGTIGGWADLRKAFVSLEKKTAKNELREKLEDAVENEQRENRQGFGSADFFNKLCEPQYHHLWSATAERNGIHDFIPYYVRYCEWMEELRELAPPDENGNVSIKPIGYTFPGTENRHKEISFRHFDFKAELNRQMKLTLFRKNTDGGKVHYELADDLPITLSARRLKRDKIITPDGTSINAMWCPPLVLEDDKPRAGKQKQGKWPAGNLAVSFSLMVEDEQQGELPPPVHLKVAIPLEWNEQKKLHAGVIRWDKGSLKGYAKKGDADADKRRHFRWPTDLETEKKKPGEADEEKVTASKLWCGDGKHPIQGFRVKKDEGTQIVPDFQILAIDLGTRFSSAFARLRIHCEPEGTGRVISPDKFASKIRAQLFRKGTLRLPGEDVKKPIAEPYGNDGRGRFPKQEEIEAFKKLAEQIVPEKAFPIIGLETMTFPEMGDHLVFRLRRRISRIRSLFNLRWRVSGTMERNSSTGKYDAPRKPENQKDHNRFVVETLGKLAFPKTPRSEGEEEHPDNRRLRDALNANETAWQQIKSDLESCKEQADEEKRCQQLDVAIKNWNWKALAENLDRQLQNYFEGEQSTARLTGKVVEHCLPLRRRHWRWIDAKHSLFMEKKETDPEYIPHIQGMRGLSIRRLEQVLSLRQRCQSYAKLEIRYAAGVNGINPPPPMKRGEGDDPCPDLLDKSNELREQRVNQAAHLILAEALGLELKNPEEVENKKARRNEVDLHGEYKRILDAKTGTPLPRCSVIVLEDLTRYRTSQDRTRSENSRLMQWAHRAIVKKLTDVAKPFGITLMLVDPAFSSRFHSQTGLPGIRVNSVSRNFEKEMPYAAWLKQKGRNGNNSDLAKKISEATDLFEQNKEYNGQLLIAVDGGKEFLPVDANDAEMQRDYHPMNADENAAINIGLRAVADPDRWDIFPRLRSVESAEASVRIRNRRGYFATLADDDDKKFLRKENSSLAPKAVEATKLVSENGEAEQPAESSQYPDFFISNLDFSRLPRSESFQPHIDSGHSFNAYRCGLFLKRVQQICEKRICQINKLRLKK